MTIESERGRIRSSMHPLAFFKNCRFDTTAAINVGVFTHGQKQFLDFHREAVLLQSNRG